MSGRFIKHVGVTTNTGSRVVVVFRTIPEDENTALVVQSDTLKDRYHQDFMQVVEGITAQQETELFKSLNTQMFSDGLPMLDTLHKKGLLMKVATTSIKMTPQVDKQILLSDLNNVLGPVNFADNGGKRQNPDVTMETAKDPIKADISNPNGPAPIGAKFGGDSLPGLDVNNGVLTDEQLAASRIKQATELEAEATRLREQAYDLDPNTKPKRGRPKKAGTTSEAIA